MEKFKTLDTANQAYQEQAEKLLSATTDLTAAQATIETAATAQAAVQAELVTAQAATTSATEKATAETARATTLEGKITALESDVATLKAEATTAEVKAAAMCAAAGVDPVALEAGAGGEGSLTEQYQAITDPVDRGEFLAKHKEAMFAESRK